MMHDHIGCTWLHLSHHMENPIAHGLGFLNISNLSHVPWNPHLTHKNDTLHVTLISIHIK